MATFATEAMPRSPLRSTSVSRLVRKNLADADENVLLREMVSADSARTRSAADVRATGAADWLTRRPAD